MEQVIKMFEHDAVVRHYYEKAQFEVPCNSSATQIKLPLITMPVCSRFTRIPAGSGQARGRRRPVP